MNVMRNVRVEGGTRMAGTYWLIGLVVGAAPAAPTTSYPKVKLPDPASADRIDAREIPNPVPTSATRNGWTIGEVEDKPASAAPTVMIGAAPAPIATPPIAWVEASALFWRIQDGPLAFPLVTTGNVVDPVAGALTQPGTLPIFGGQGLDYDTATGWRLSAGAWLGDSPFGGEVSYFKVRTPRLDFAASSDANGRPLLYLPAFSVTANSEGSLIVADPLLLFAGGVEIWSRSELWGWEANAVIAATHGGFCDIDLLAGYRTVTLEEDLSIRNRTRDLILGTLTTFGERFSTTNEFHGGQVGARATVHHGKWFASATGKLAVGWTHSEVEVVGVTTQSAPAPLPAGSFPGGFFTQRTNAATQSDIACTVIPELNLRVGCDVWGCVRLFVGCDCLYWNRVTRPGDNIDRALNLTQSPVFGGGTLIGVPRPAPPLNTTDFFAQGISAGIELRY
jgi:hypothetical protein